MILSVMLSFFIMTSCNNNNEEPTSELSTTTEIITLGGCTFEISWVGPHTEDEKKAIKAGLANAVVPIFNSGNPVKVSIYADSDRGWNTPDEMFRSDLWENPDYQTSSELEALFTSGDKLLGNEVFFLHEPIRSSIFTDVQSWRDLPKRIDPKFHSNMKGKVESFLKKATLLLKERVCLDDVFVYLYKGHQINVSIFQNYTTLSTIIDSRSIELMLNEDCLHFTQNFPTTSGLFGTIQQVVRIGKSDLGYSAYGFVFDSISSSKDIQLNSNQIVETFLSESRIWNEILN